MCYPTRCKHCGKTTWSGCGKHVADVRQSVAADKWCSGHDSLDNDSPGNDSWLRRILGR